MMYDIVQDFCYAGSKLAAANFQASIQRCWLPAEQYFLRLIALITLRITFTSQVSNIYNLKFYVQL